MSESRAVRVDGSMQLGEGRWGSLETVAVFPAPLQPGVFDVLLAGDTRHVRLTLFRSDVIRLAQHLARMVGEGEPRTGEQLGGEGGPIGDLYGGSEEDGGEGP